jgi:hypothetical protein
MLSEIAKRSSFWGAIFASLPMMSIFAFVWIFLETKNTVNIAQLSLGIAWLVVPSLILFVLFPILLGKSMNFWLALLLSSAATVVGYIVMLRILKIMNISI